jgi:hypothetical protein
MTALLFELTFLSVAPFWGLMILVPAWRGTRALAASPLICVPPLLIYAVLIASNFIPVLSTVADPDLSGLRDLLGGESGAALAWAHLVGFDLFAGRWIYLDSRARGIPAVPVSVLLTGTVLLAPLGMLAYLLLRSVHVRRRARQPVSLEI